MGIFDTFGAGNRGGSGMSPVMLGLMGLLAYRTLKGKGRLADMLGTGTSDSATGGAPGVSTGLGSGLKDLLDRFRQNGHEDKVQSWVSTGANKPIAAPEVEQALGEERIEWLVQQTGMPRDKLLQGLSGELPQAIDKLTPDGRLPTDEELSRSQ